MGYASTLFAFALVLLATTSVRASDESDVLVLTSENFDATISGNNLVMVEFYAPWCGHCKNLAPKYEVAATQLKGVAPLAKVDCTAENDLCGKFEVKGYPTVKVFRNGKPTDYPGARETDAIVSFMKKQNAPAVSDVAASGLDALIDSDKVVVVFFGDKSSTEFAQFKSVAEKLHNDFTFGASDAEAGKSHGASANGIVLFKKFDERKNVFDGSATAADIEAFVKGNSTPTMDDIGPDNYNTYAESGLPLAYLFVNNDEQRQSVGVEVEAIAKEFKGKVNFVYIDGNKYGGHASNLNLKQEWPAFAIQRPQQNLKYPFDQSQTITKDSIRAFVTDFVNGKIQPSLKSEEIPAEQGDVVVVVGKQYSEIVNQPKDVLIEFYAPWCGHCKKLAPIYDELGEKLKANKNIVIAKMDATANDLPADAPFQVSGFPTIKLVKADNTVVDYNGDRTLDDFIKFLKENSTNGSGLIVGGEEAAAATDAEPKKVAHNEL